MSLKFEHIADFIKQPRSYDIDLLERIQNFLRTDLKYQKFTGQFRLFDYGSCSQIELFFDKKWNLITPELNSNNESNFEFRIYVSARGPLITSTGVERLARLELITNSAVEEKAQVLAESIAQKFNLMYVKAKWLEQFSLNKKDLTSDASLSLDFSEPTALNILFSEIM
jgi:hypothetical protein